MRRTLTRALALALCLGLAAPLAADEPSYNGLVSEVRQLTFGGKRSGEGYFTADGRAMVFQSEREPGNPFYQIYRLDLLTGASERISTGTGKTTCAWAHPDDDHVLFASTHEDPEAVAKQKAELALRARGTKRRYAWDYDETFELFLRSRKRGTLRRLTRAKGYDAEGAISPDGKWIVWSSNRHAYAGGMSKEEAARFGEDKSVALELYRMRIDDGAPAALTRPQRLTTAPGYDGGPFFSADGKRICWRRFAVDGATAEIWVADADGGNARAVTKLGAMSWAPYFHPSGDYLIFATNKHGFANFELYLVRADGRGEPVRVTTRQGFDGLPVFTPDGRKLAWTSNRTGSNGSQIFIGDWDHQRALALLYDPAAEAPTSEDAMMRRARQAGRQMMLRGDGGTRSDDVSRYLTAFGAAVYGERKPGSQGAARLGRLLAGAFDTLGLEPDSSRGALPAAQALGAARGRLLAGEQPSETAVVVVARVAAGRNPAADSGLAALLEAAQLLAHLRRGPGLSLKRDVIFVAWPEGAAMAPLARPGDACLLLDAVGGERMSARGLATSHGWGQLLEAANMPVGLPLRALPKPAAGLELRGVPALSLGGAAADARVPERIARAGRLVARLAEALARSEAPLRYASAKPKPKPASKGVVMGTIPEYRGDGKPGVLLSGVSPGSPAAKAGLRKGDRVVSLAGQAIGDIRAYARVIGTLQAGKPIQLAVVRGGERIELSITPTARK